MIVTLFAFVLTLAVLIAVHEYGHYRMAVACGVRVLRFSLGFGRVIWRHQRSANDTEWVVSMLPLGGYVRMLDETEGPVDDDQLARAFNRQPLAKRAAIVAAGPIANLLLAVVLYSAVQWIGIEEPQAILSAPAVGSLAEQAGLRSGDQVMAWRDASNAGSAWQDISGIGELRWQITQHVLSRDALVLQVRSGGGRSSHEITLDPSRLASREVDSTLMAQLGLGAPYSEAVLGEVKPGGPAADAGLRAGDHVLRIDDRVVADSQSLRTAIRAAVDGAVGRRMQWAIERSGAPMTITVQPRVVTEAGQSLGRVDAFIGKAPATVLVRRGAVDGLVAGWQRTIEVSGMTVDMLVKMLSLQASWHNLSGPLTIADYAGQSVQLGLPYYLGFLALVSVSLGILNLLPLPMLDGGHLLYYLFEGVTGRPVSGLWLARLQRGGVAILMLMMSVALYNDVARLLGAH
jgi:regulator of sigma E protease